jgi:hypothetical protein
MGVDIAELRASGNDVMLVQWSAIDTHMTSLGADAGAAGYQDGKTADESDTERAARLFDEHRGALWALFDGARDAVDNDKAPVGQLFDAWSAFGEANGCVRYPHPPPK